ncbi:MAG: Crp/Fnr family transcriptional regulator [Bacteroidota bacterium]
MEEIINVCNCEICLLRTLFFEHLGSDELGDLCSNKAERNYAKGEIIIKEGAEIKDFMYLKSGLVKIYKEEEGEERQIITLAQPHDFVCIFTIFSDTNYHYSIAAIEETTICSVSLEKVKQMIYQNGQFAFDLLQRISKATDQIIKLRFDISKKQLHGRIAYVLLYFADVIFKSNSFDLPISRKEFSEFIGMSIENVIRTLSEFRKDKLIIINGKNIEIIKKDLLQRICDAG